MIEPTNTLLDATPNRAEKRNGEYHLFIIWEAARSHEAPILEDIRRNFEIVAVREVRWSAAHTGANFTRFYGQNLPPGSFKEEHCGAGPFLAVVVHDPFPVYENRQTSKGQRRVNIHTFDAKQRYRELTGGGHRVHATDTETETRHDVALLFATPLRDFIASRSGPWNGSVEILSADLAGANGWRDLRELFALLNETIRYIVLRNFEGLPDNHTTQLHGDIDLLTDAPQELAFIVNAEKVFPETHRVHFAAQVAGQRTLFDFRFVGDDYYTQRWQEDMLTRRLPLPTGIFAPTPEDHFYSLLHHALIHKREVGADYVSRLRALGTELGLEWTRDLSFANPRAWRGALEGWLREKGYRIVRPSDASVFFNEAILEGNFEWEAIHGGLPLALGLEQLISARMLAEHEAKRYFSYVFHDAGSDRVIKQATDDLALRDAKFLQQLTGPFFPRAFSAEQHDGWSLAAIESVEGEPLHKAAREITRTPQRLAEFFHDCLDLLAQLQASGITHRDIRSDNLLVRNGRPVLIDFGWSISDEQPMWTPSGLGEDGCPADGVFCDVFAMGKVFEKLPPGRNHATAPLIALMTAQDRAARVVSIPALKLLLQSQPLHATSAGDVSENDAGAADQLTLKSLPGPKLLEVFSVRTRSEFEELYRTWLGRTLESQGRFIPAVQKPFTMPGHCVVCGETRNFMTDFLYATPDAKGKLQPSWRERQVCTCKLNSRQRACFHVLAEGLGLPETARIYCAEQSSELFARIKKRFPLTIGSEFLGDSVPLGRDDSRGVRNEDITRLTFSDNAFDCIVCLEVLEHVADYASALAELARCLSPGGILLLTTPIHFKQDKTIARAKTDPDEAVNDFGWDLTEEIRRAGFSDARINFFTSEDYGYLGTHCVLLARRQQSVLATSSRKRTLAAPGPVARAHSAPPLESESTESLLVRAQLLRQESKWLEAGLIFQTLIQRLPDDLSVWRCRIECSRKLGHKVLTKLLIQDALRIHPDWANEINPAEPSRKEAETVRATPLVSVIIPVLNKIDLTRKCLEELRKNTPTELYEVVVWDNASTDGTQAFFQQQSPSHPAVRYFRSEENLGFVGGNNAAVQHARGRFLVFLNNDTEPQPGWLQALLQTIEADPTVGAVGAKLIYPDGKLQEAGGIIFRDASGWNYGRTQDPRDPHFNFPREVDYCSAACLLVPSELFRQLGGFDSRYSPAYYEDTDLCFALRHAGYKVLYQPRCEIIHHEGATAGQELNKGFKQYQVTNRQKFFDKWTEILAKQAAPDAAVVRRASHRARGQRILVIDPVMPMYDRASGSKRLFEMLKLLAAGGNAVTFIARNGQNGERYAAELEQLGIEVYAGDPERLSECGCSAKCRPLDLKKLLQDSQYDTVILSFWYIAEQYLSRIRAWSPTSRVLIDTVDVHFLRERRQGELYQDQKLLQQAESTHRREIKIYRQADALITVTEDDRRTLLQELPGTRIFIVPNIHDLAKNAPPVNNRDGLLFVGGFGHPPNEDAVLYFHREIWPLVLQRVPKARWTIVGNNPSAAVRALAGGAIQVTGYVPDVEPFLHSHLISIAPLRYGAGMKGKIGEALAHGLPVVTTSIGVEGMGLQNGDAGALVADDPEIFAAHVGKLYADRDLWNELSAQGRRHIESHFTPQCIERQLKMLLDWSGSFTSIIILAHNQWDHTEKCLQSISRHTEEPHEIILVDNGSSDKTPGALRALAMKNPRVRVIVNGSNRGFAAGNNQGLAIASGKNIVLLNNDTVVTPGWLTRLLAVLEQHPDTGLVGPMSNRVSGPQLVNDVNYTNLAELPAFAERWAVEHHGESFELGRAVGFCLLARREVINRIGGLDERFGSGNFEDDDFCIRAKLASFWIRAAKDAFVHHVGGQTFKGANIDYRATMLRNWALFKTKWAMPKSLTMEQGYCVPTSLPAGGKLLIPLPKLQDSHSPSVHGRLWRDKTSKRVATPNPVTAAAVQLPPCALVGNLKTARELLNKKQYSAARAATTLAIQSRPYHPEGYLLVAEIAKAAGDISTARQCAQRAKNLAPGWKAPKEFLKSSLNRPGKALPHPEHEFEVDAAQPQRLSVCLIVRNEEEFLDRCLASVRGIASQIIVVDTGSTDRTIDIAKAHGAEVYHFPWRDDFSAARNEALQHATGDWILSLDADEELLPDHRESLCREMQGDGILAYRIRLVDKGHEEEGHSYVPRLFRNAPGLFFVGRVHEQVFSSIQVRCQQWGLKNVPGQTTLLHHGYSAELLSGRNKIERNLSLLEVAIEELPNEPHLLMSYGLELVRSGQVQDGLEQYVEALRCLADLPPADVTPELRETLLTQLTSHLLAAKCHAEIVKVWEMPVAKAAEMTASQHFVLGLAHIELKQPGEAAEQMRQCVAKRNQPVFTPVNPEILKAAPNHCLALCLASIGQPDAARQAFDAALAFDPTSRVVRFDLARFYASQGAPVDALKVLTQLVSENPAEAKVWHFGGQIALSRPECREFAGNWTSEAVKHFPQHHDILVQRAEALMVNGGLDQALPLWRRAHSPNSARHRAAIVLCELLVGDRQYEFLPAEEPAISREAVHWYRQWISGTTHAVVHRLHERMDQIRLVLPTFVNIWEAADRQARKAAA